jgi:hypothetical protein
VIPFGTSLVTAATFGSLRVWTSEVIDFSCLRCSWLTCFVSFFYLLCLIFALALVSFSHSLWPFFLTCFGHWPGWFLDLLRVSSSFVYRLAPSLALRLLFTIVDFDWSILVVSDIGLWS